MIVAVWAYGITRKKAAGRKLRKKLLQDTGMCLAGWNMENPLQEESVAVPDPVEKPENTAAEAQTDEEKNEPGAQPVQETPTVPQLPHPLTVIVNHTPITMQGKASYVFVDVFDYIDFDLGSAASAGRSIVTNLNGRPAQYMETLTEGDVIEIYWKNLK